MTVLKPEVWLSIVAALTVTAFMIWLLDKYSPYSAQNNQPKYEQFRYAASRVQIVRAEPDLKTPSCPDARNFTLVESFWFALTSFTPQGGGETPKAISGRVLVAAYWVFVVLMLATFTANLAAFLTVERMQVSRTVRTRFACSRLIRATRVLIRPADPGTVVTAAGSAVQNQLLGDQR